MASFHLNLFIFTFTFIGHLNNIKGQSDIIMDPVIGILTQEVDSDLISIPPGATSFHLNSYVKWLQSQKAIIVPIRYDTYYDPINFTWAQLTNSIGYEITALLQNRINQTDSYYSAIFNSINGLVIPGGSSSIRTSLYSKAGSILYDLAIKANNNGDFFPIWGTCLGFQLLLYLSAGKKSYLANFPAQKKALPLNFLAGANTSRLFENTPVDVMYLLRNNQSTPNFHNYGISPQNFTLSGLDKFYTNLATSIDDYGSTFIASIEAKGFPIWGSQFHPEASGSWPPAVKPGLYFAEFFVNQTRKNQHQFALGASFILNDLTSAVNQGPGKPSAFFFD